MPGGSGPLLTANTLAAENSGTPASACRTEITYESLNIYLGNLPDGGIPVTITATALHTEAVAGPSGAPVTGVQIADLAVNGQPVANVSPAPNTVLLDLSTLNLPGVTGSVVLHDQSSIPGGIAANAIRVRAVVVNQVTGLSQQIDVKIGHAEADIH